MGITTRTPIAPITAPGVRDGIGTSPRRPDGVQAMSVPRHDADSPDELPLREFDSSGVGWLPALTHSTSEQCLLLVGNVADDVRGWLSTGQALERVLLEIARAGYAASPFTQVVEVPRLRAELRSALGLDMWPHVLLRVGHAPPTPATRRRPLSAVLLEI